MSMENERQGDRCSRLSPNSIVPEYCKITDLQRFDRISGGFGGFNRSLELASLSPDSIANEFISFSV
jgi:hypothetical protein